MSNNIIAIPDYKVYGLFDPRDQKCYYVGRTGRTLERRLLDHWYSRRLHACLKEWLLGMEQAGEFPEIRLLAVENDPAEEVAWITKMSLAGHPVLNKVSISQLKSCKLGGCGRPVEAHGLCHAHYLRVLNKLPSAWKDTPLRKPTVPARVKSECDKPPCVRPILTEEERRRRQREGQKRWRAENQDKVIALRKKHKLLRQSAALLAHPLSLSH